MSSPGCGPRARRSVSRSARAVRADPRVRRLRVVDRRRRSASRRARSPRWSSVSRSCPPLFALAALPLLRRKVLEASRMSLPTAGLPADQVLDELRALRSGDLPTHGGRTLAYVYDSGLGGLDDLAARRARARQLRQRARPDRVPQPAAHGERGRRRRGRAARRRPRDGRHGDVRWHRELHARRARGPRRATRRSTHPKIVLASTAHAAFHKAAHYFGVEAVAVPVSARRPSAPTRTRWPPRSTTGPCSSWSARRPTRTASSTRWRRSPRRRRGVACGVMSTRASAGGCCRTSARSACRCRTSTCRCPA